jgi:hypothetical protein
MITFYSVLPAWDVVRSVTKLYLQFCDCQPLPLFDADELANSLESRDQETLFAILALALRFSKDAILQDNVVEFTEGYAESARKLVIKRVIQGPVELSTLQALCLLSCVDFTSRISVQLAHDTFLILGIDGHKHRSSIYYSLAANLAQCAGLTTESPSSFPGPILEERRRCFWSIFMLKRLHGEDVSVVDFPGEDNYPLYPKTIGFIPGNNEAGSSSANSVNPTPNTTPKDTGVVSYALQLSELWGKTTKYARRREAPSKIPPWSSLSEYAAIMTQQMDCDTRIPCIYRLKPSGFANKSPTELNSSRNYWGPWLFIQFLYHTNLCLLNHPLILDLRLRNFEKKMPEIFVQHTSELITAHASRIVYLIDTVKEKSFKVSDPFLGHCSAIVATIFLQESISEDENVRKEKQGAFEKCFEFVQSFEDEWPHMARLADKLQLLKNTVSSSYQTPANSQTPDRGLLIDRARFWDVLDYSSSSELPETTGLFFGASIFSGS